MLFLSSTVLLVLAPRTDGAFWLVFVTAGSRQQWQPVDKAMNYETETVTLRPLEAASEKMCIGQSL